MSSGTSAKFNARKHTVAYLLGLGTMLVLPISQVPLLRLQKQGANTVLASGACDLAQMSLA